MGSHIWISSGVGPFRSFGGSSRRAPARPSRPVEPMPWPIATFMYGGLLLALVMSFVAWPVGLLLIPVSLVVPARVWRLMELRRNPAFRQQDADSRARVAANREARRAEYDLRCLAYIDQRRAKGKRGDQKREARIRARVAARQPRSM
jgi:hypothetical protein